jgi:beta-lactamase regulating signal transducer with metallopeptidase domain
MLKNKKMNTETYKLRRKVIDIIYDLKKHIDLPRIEVKITDDNQNTLGLGTMKGKPKIWIVERAVNMSHEKLVHIVAHEIGHAVFSLDHSQNCPLMGTTLTKPASLEQIVQVLAKAK